MGVVLGLLPTKGLNLPFISAGGSSLIANLFAIGLFLSAIVQRKKELGALNIEDSFDQFRSSSSNMNTFSNSFSQNVNDNKMGSAPNDNRATSQGELF